MDPQKSNWAPPNPDDRDARYNPADLDAAEKNYQERIKSGPSQPVDPSAINNKEETPDDSPIRGGLFNPSGKERKERRNPRQMILSLIKKRSPLTVFVVMLLGGGGFALLLTPGLGLLQLKETLLGDLNDQLTAVDIRSNALWKARLSSLEANGSVCSGPVKIRCKFTSFGTKQIAKLKKVGFTFEENKAAFGRTTVSNFKAPDGTAINNPADLRRLVQEDPDVRSALARVYNPFYDSLSDSNFMKTLTGLKTSKARTVTGNTPEELETSLRESTDGDALTNSNGKPLTENGRNYVVDEDGVKVYESGEGADPDNYKRLTDIAAEKRLGIMSQANVSGKAFNGVLNGAVKGANILGAADTACTVYNLSRSVAAAAKVARSLQLAQYFMEFAKAGDDIIEGDATPEKVAFFSEKLAAVNNNEKILDTTAENDTAGMNPEEVRDYVATHIDEYKVDNPDFGKSGFDADAYKVIAYNDAPVFSAQDQQYLVAAGFVGSLSEITDKAIQSLGGNQKTASETCGVVQSWWVRGAGLAIGVIAGVGSAGATTLLSIGGSIAVSMAIPLLESMLTDIIAGKVTEGISGTQSMTAAVVGGSVVLGQAAQGRGMKPQTKDEIAATLEASKQTQEKYIAMERYEAASTPFDITKQYSFLGSLARTVNIPLTKAASSVNGSLTAVPALLSASIASIIPSASAATAYNPERYNKCKDIGYQELGIAADIFCNIRYGMSQTELNMDPLEALDYLSANKQINDDGVAVPGSDYEKFIKYCAGGRQEGFGETGEEGAGDWGTGLKCMENSATMSYYRVYTIDKSIDEGMEEEGLEAGAGAGPSRAVGANGLTSPINPVGLSNSGGFGPRVPPCPSCSNWHQGDDLINSTNPEVYSIMAGTVISVDKRGEAEGTKKLPNNILRIQHADGLISSYWHMKGSMILVDEGQTVTAGQQIGTIGNVGQSTGKHLHIELDISEVQDREAYTSTYRVNPAGYDPGLRIEPTDYFRKNKVEGFL